MEPYCLLRKYFTCKKNVIVEIMIREWSMKSSWIVMNSILQIGGHNLVVGHWTICLLKFYYRPIATASLT